MYPRLPLGQFRNEWQRRGATVQKGGHFYTVDLADEHIAKMLDWDAPLSDQPASVQRVVARIKDANHGGITYAEPLRHGTMTGEGLYGALEREFGSSQAASQFLAGIGIPGIKYFDGGSRAAGKGTRNFVIFDPDVARIIGREGGDTVLASRPAMTELLHRAARQNEAGSVATQSSINGIVAARANTRTPPERGGTTLLSTAPVGVRARAEWLQSVAGRMGIPAAVNHSGSAAGRSSYLRIGGSGEIPEYFEIRVSDHGIGPRRAAQEPQTYVDGAGDSILDARRQIETFVARVNESRRQRNVAIKDARARLGLTEDAGNNRRIEQRRFSTEGVPVETTRREAGLEPDGSLTPLKPMIGESAAPGGVLASRRDGGDAEWATTARAYGGRKAYDRAKAAGRTTLNYNQWVQVRTQNFKRWFGDWELARSLRRRASTFTEAREAAANFQGTELVSLDGMKAILSRTNLDKMLSKTAVHKSESPQEHALAVANLDQLFESARLGWSKADREGDPNVRAIHRMFTTMRVGDEARLVKLTVKESALAEQGSKIYSVESVQVEGRSPVPEMVDADRANGSRLLTGPTGLAESLAQRVRDFKPSTVSKVVNRDTGEPLVVYHGSEEWFTTFRSTDDIGFHFGDEAAARERLEQTGVDDGMIRPFYVAARNPLRLRHDPGEWKVYELVSALPQSVFDELAGRSADRYGAERSDVVEWVDDGGGHDFLSEQLEDIGYDGIAYGNAFEGGESFVAFRPEQIKSAIDIRGTFDPDNPSILASRPQPMGRMGGSTTGTQAPAAPMPGPQTIAAGGGEYTTAPFLGMPPEMQQALLGVMQLPETHARIAGERVDETVSWEQTGQEAEALLGSEFGKLFNDLANRTPRSAANAARLEAFARIVNTGGRAVVEAAQQYNRTGSAEDLKRLVASKEQLGLVMAPFMGYRTEAGRALQVLQKMQADFRDATAIFDALGNGTEQAMRDFAQRIAKAPTVEAALSLTRAAYRPSLWDQFYEYWINGLLSGPWTHLVNLSSNALFNALEAGTELVAGLVSPNVSARGALARVSGQVAGLQLGLANAGKAFTTEEPQLNPTTQVESEKRRAIPGKMGRLVRLPGRALMAEDEFAKAIAFSGEMHRLAMERALAANPRNPQAVFAQELAALANDRAAQAQARKAADRLTFQTPLGALGNMGTYWLNRSKVGRVLVPFVRTPTNILKRAPLRHEAKAVTVVRADFSSLVDELVVARWVIPWGGPSAFSLACHATSSGHRSRPGVRSGSSAVGS